MTEFSQLIDLSTERLGGAALAASDDFFAPKENLLKHSAPIFIPDKYTERGKWMDGWESRRRRTPGHDWCIIRMGLPGILRSVVVDTAYFRGNFPTHCSLDACVAPPDVTADELIAAARWSTILAQSELQGDTQNTFAIEAPGRFTHLRLNIYPDGGVARLRTMGEVVPDWRAVFEADGDIDLASVTNGARAIDTSDRFFGEPHNMLMPYKAANMGDGWETRRRRGPGHDWAIVQLAVEGTISRIEVDTAHFIGNYPESCSIDVANAPEAIAGSDLARLEWRELLARTTLQPNHAHVYADAIDTNAAATHLRLNIYPDGGVSRFRVFGRPTSPGRRRALLQLLNALDAFEARQTFEDCCAASSWVRRMCASRPFRSEEDLFAAADAAADDVPPLEWREALAHHPRIGETRAEAQQSARAQAWSAGEQSAARHGDQSRLSALADLNREYEARFGYVFVVCATGRSATEISDLLRQRLNNDPDTELRVAAAEHRRITRLRLEKLLT
jgi:allantoicase